MPEIILNPRPQNDGGPVFFGFKTAEIILKSGDFKYRRSFCNANSEEIFQNSETLKFRDLRLIRCLRPEVFYSIPVDRDGILPETLIEHFRRSFDSINSNLMKVQTKMPDVF
ncbi:hypothetical protein Nepgr_014854 [Nepenthes gracilis]|uniref:Uncharacterized protein n=1 Tax=Nepenthes gracilis TaxID=150966 RepID=A0AAD3SKR6_NEPGR|nr:hypothetical protein Nepgr_014854 [Nepenthes gracilis]